ncbi:MAG: ABC transporter ATP-binding protein [Bacteroidetes bacterium]|nr:ABC transporter ATP-binding protein [Bacteroidota bacterium]MDA1121464.1 ABC transporter ATP-binding protein [Bacteroidota bacterium]
MSEAKTILKAQNLTIGYGKKTIQSGLEISLIEGEVVCLLGQNGVGKTTLLQTLAGMILPIGGSILIRELEFGDYSRLELAKTLGIVTTEKITAAGLTVLEVLMSGRYPHQQWMSSPNDTDFEAIHKAVSLTKIKYILDSKLTELSDGQRQKVMIARALVQDGDIILLDEPTAHLDLNNRVEIIRLLRDIATDQKKALLISTHEVNLALQFADKLWLMDFGEPLVQGTPDDLLNSGKLNRIFHTKDFEYDFRTGKISLNDKTK